MNSQRLVSVVVAVCRTEFFEAALRSVIEQTHGAIEIVICDDATDGLARTVIELYQASCPWPIRYLRNEQAQGANRCMIRGLAAANGHYIKFLDGDALMEPDCIKELVKALEIHPGARLASSHRRWLDADDAPLPENLVTRLRFGEPTVLRGRDVVAFLGEFTCNFIGELNSVLCRRADLLALGDDLFSLRDEQLPTLSSLVLYARLLHEGDLILLPPSLSATRIAPRHLTDRGIEIAGANTECVHRFHRLIRESGWASASLSNGWVGIRGLAGRAEFSDFNLLAQLAAPLPQRLNPQQVQAWQSARTPDVRLHNQLDDYLLRAGVPSLLIVLTDLDNAPHKVLTSLESLDPLSAVDGSLQVVVLSSATRLPDHALGSRVSLLTMPAPNLAAALNRVADECAFEWLMVVDAGSRFTPFGLTACALSLIESPETLAAFADEMHLNAKGELSSALRPDFNLDYLLSYPLLTAGHWLFSRSLLVSLGGFDAQFTDAAQLDLILRLIEREGADRILHVSEPLLICEQPVATANDHELATLQRHLNVRGYPQATVVHTLPRRYHVLYGHTDRPLVSIIVPTKDQLPFLQRCVETLLHTTAYPNYELLIVDNNSETPEALEWLAGIDALNSEKVRVLRYPYPFNYSRINNVAAAQAKGDYLVLLNNDTAIVHERWLDELLNHAQRPEVGVVGAKLLFPGGRLQHAGVRLGMDGPAGHQHLGEPQFVQGYMQRVQVDQDLSAVTAACLIVRRSIYEEVGGLDEDAFVVSYNDVDLCLKVGALGYLNVWTPHAVLIHEGSVSQNTVDTATQLAKHRRFTGEQLAMYRKWLPTLARDSAFNRHLSFDLHAVELELNMRLAWPPAIWRPAPLILAYAGGAWAASAERVNAPFQALLGRGDIGGLLSSSHLSIPQEARLDPDVMVFQARLDLDHIQAIARASLLPNAFVVLDLSDVQLASDDADGDAFAFDVVRLDALQKSLREVNRVVASTPLLADIAREYHTDVRLLPSRLPIEAWGNLSSLRGQGDKPRVGLVSQHWQLQDLHMILPVVQALAEEVQWIVMGDVQGVLRPYSHEWHELPAPEHYPAALAGLNLDLALLPAVDNLLSACGRNLAVLQLGSCGVPLVCSDVRAYHGDLAVTCVPNTLSAWVSLIRAHTADLASAALLGDQLREQVLRDWMLDEAAMEAWRQAWLP
ncbi:glycosyltransferase [Pseudomonas sp. F3-2]|uniref:glycosyltransferase family 2 protein n=1 Tax=Pseudomonas sp. F3-2 TaxID=3141539 RepID=UPI00315D86E9